MDKLSQQQRILLAVVLSFLFFAIYSYFMPKHQQKIENNTTINSTVESTKSTNTKTLKKPKGLEINQMPILSVVKSKFFKASIDELGRIASFKLLDPRYEDHNKALDLISQAFSPLPLELRFSDEKLNNEAFSTPYTASDSNIIIKDEGSVKLILSQKLSTLSLTKTLVFHPNGTYEVSVSLDKEANFFITPGFRPNVAVDSLTVHGALLMDKDDKLHILSDGDIDKDEAYDNISIAAASDRYYTTFFYNFKNPMKALVSKDKDDNSLLFIAGKKDFFAKAYIGPKAHSLLSSIDERLESVIEYGWFTFIAKPMFWFLNYIHTYIGNWGWAIVVLTLIIRLLLFPLTYKSMISMNKLKELMPKVKDIREKYKGEPQKINMHTMELYKKHGANPLGGCLPILMQIPIFFAIYRVLLNAIELKGAAWILWLNDLSVQDPYFVLPILMGAAMFAQQLITPMTIQDPTQQKIMKFLPLIFVFFFITFPAGLTLYWFINNTCSLIQQAVVNKLFKSHEIAMKEEHKKHKEEKKLESKEEKKDLENKKRAKKKGKKNHEN